MVGMKEICGKIKSVQNMCKIMKVMEMVVVLKMCCVQECMCVVCLYVDKVCVIVVYMSCVNFEYCYLFMVVNDGVQMVGIIFVMMDKGLCGGLNINVLCVMVQKFKELEEKGQKVEVIVIGGKGFGFLNCFGVKVMLQVVYFGDILYLDKLIGVVKMQFDLYLEGKLLVVYIVYMCFVNMMKQEVVIEQLLLLLLDYFEVDDGMLVMLWDYIYELDVQVVVDELFVCYVEVLVYQVVVENMVFE